jgi:copper chaperone CopZ
MFNFLKPKTNNNLETVNLKLTGLHCSSCAVNIDLTLEDIPGVKNSSTNYAQSTSKVTFYSTKTDIDSIKKTIHNLGYQTI